MSNKVTAYGIEQIFLNEHFDEDDDQDITNAKRCGFYTIVIETLCRELYNDNNFIAELLLGENRVREWEECD